MSECVCVRERERERGGGGGGYILPQPPLAATREEQLPSSGTQRGRGKAGGHMGDEGGREDGGAGGGGGERHAASSAVPGCPLC